MNKLQFRVLYRQFVFRMVDLALLAIGGAGDMLAALAGDRLRGAMVGVPDGCLRLRQSSSKTFPNRQ